MRNRLRDNLALTNQRIEYGTRRTEDFPARYRNEQEFLADLHLIRDSLESHGDQPVARGELLDLMRLVETFGFFLLHLDIRQESTRHCDAVTELYAKLPSKHRLHDAG